VLLARDPDGGLVTIDESDMTLQERLASTRLVLQAHDLTLAGVLEDWGLAATFLGMSGGTHRDHCAGMRATAAARGDKSLRFGDKLLHRR
jgi:hypothetical protein